MIQTGFATTVLALLRAHLGEDISSTGALFVHSRRDAQADLVSVQLLAAKVAETRGLNPDKPRHLTRSGLLSDE